MLREVEKEIQDLMAQADELAGVARLAATAVRDEDHDAAGGFAVLARGLEEIARRLDEEVLNRPVSNYGKSSDKSENLVCESKALPRVCVKGVS